MKLKEIIIGIKNFGADIWKAIDSVDCPDNELETSDAPEIEALRDSLEKVNKMEENFKKAERNGKTTKVVETVTIHPETMKKLAQESKQKVSSKSKNLEQERME